MFVSNPARSLALVCLLASSVFSGCGTTEVSRDVVVQDELERWTEVLYVGMWGVQFEREGHVDWSGNEQAFVYEGFTLRRTSKELQVQGHWYPFRTGSHVRLYRPVPKDEASTAVTFGQTELRWRDASRRILVEERRPGARTGAILIWHFPEGRVEVQSDGRAYRVVHVDQRDPERAKKTVFAAKSTITVERSGALYGSTRPQPKASQ